MIQLETRLVEAAVEAVAIVRDDRTFYQERDRIYEQTDPEDREPLFAELHGGWFERFNLEEPIRGAFADLPLIEESFGLCVVAIAKRASDEGAELFVRPPEPDVDESNRRRVVIRLLPASFIDLPGLKMFLARELLHVADMLDPAFGYDPVLPAGLAGQTQDRLLMDRYSVLWATTVAGRLLRRGLLEQDARLETLERFGTTFRMLTDEELADAFSYFFDGDRPTHDNLVTFSQDPLAWTGTSSSDSPGSGCILCQMPMRAWILKKKLTDWLVKCWAPSRTIKEKRKCSFRR